MKVEVNPRAVAVAADVMHDLLRDAHKAEQKRGHRVDQQRDHHAALKQRKTAALRAAKQEDQRNQDERGKDQRERTPADAREGAGLVLREYFARVGREQRIAAIGGGAVGAETKAESVERERRISIVFRRVDGCPEIFRRIED